MTSHETISVTIKDTTSIISRYCLNCGFDRKNHPEHLIKSAISFDEKFICIKCDAPELIIKMKRELESDIKIPYPEEKLPTLEEKLKIHGLVLFEYNENNDQEEEE